MGSDNCLFQVFVWPIRLFQGVLCHTRLFKEVLRQTRQFHSVLCPTSLFQAVLCPARLFKSVLCQAVVCPTRLFQAVLCPTRLFQALLAPSMRGCSTGSPWGHEALPYSTLLARTVLYSTGAVRPNTRLDHISVGTVTGPGYGEMLPISPASNLAWIFLDCKPNKYFFQVKCNHQLKGQKNTSLNVISMSHWLC